MERNINDIIFRDDLYPRIETNPTTVQKYAEDLDMLPPIEINQHNELIDGWHRWTAHKKEKRETIAVEITETKSDTHLLELAIERNARHGLQLSQQDKKDMARRIYHITPERERDKKKAHLAKILSVSERTVRDWLSRIDKDTKETRNKRIFDLWMACYTQEEISEREGISQPQVKEILSGMADLPKSIKPAAEHLTDFDIPVYNVWKYKENTPGSTHYGNTNIKILDNLLYLYTQPFDVVIDPFAGGGSTIDLCKKRFRRYWVSDRLPIVEREKDIRKHDIVDGLPPLPRWKDVKLVYLDPPYWKQAQGKYSNDKSDLSNMEIDIFHETLSGLIKSFSKKLQSKSYIALIIQPTQWNAPDKIFTDHIAEMIRTVNLTINMRYLVPYESQQANAQMVEWAKQNRKCLVLSRELMVWEV